MSAAAVWRIRPSLGFAARGQSRELTAKLLPAFRETEQPIPAGVNAIDMLAEQRAG